MKRHLFLLLLFFSWAGLVFGAKRYASPSGLESNSGDSPAAPWSLSFAIGSSSTISPGDSLILLDGVYGGNYISTINGTLANPIYILPANEGKAIIDVSKNRTTGTGLSINGTYTWVIGIHVTSSTLIRKSDASNGFSEVQYESGISVSGDNNKIINCWVYDVVGGGLELWRSGLNLEVYGSVIFNNGSQSEPRGTGHGMYIQHDQPDQPKSIENNVIFQNASQGINVFTTNPVNKGIIIKRNVSFNTGVMATFDPLIFRPPHNLTIGSQNNVSSEMQVTSNLFYSDLQGGRLSTNGVSNVTLGRTYFPNQNISFNDNIVFGGRNQVEFQPLEGLRFQRNKLFNVHGSFFAFLGNSSSFPNATWDSNVYSNIANTDKPFQGLTFTEWKSEFFPFDNTSSSSNTPSKTREVLITQNKYDPFRFHVSILSFNGSEQIELDFSDFAEFKDASYEIRDFQNPFDPNQKVSGTFGGNSISFPMNWTKSLQPKGNMPFQVKHTDSTFGTFLLIFNKKQNNPVEFPEVRNSVTLYLNDEGKAILTPKDFLFEEVSESFTYHSSVGFTFSCEDIGVNEIKLTLKKPEGESKEFIVKLFVEDKISPKLVTKIPDLAFDLIKGELLLKAEDFVSSLTDNCGIKTLELSKSKITCENFKAPIELILTAVDLSGNKTSEVLIVSASPFESKKISISPSTGTEFLEGQSAEIRLGEEFGFTVLGWYRNGQLIEGQKGKAILTKEPGTYWAKLVSNDGGCEVESKKTEIKFTSQPFGQIKESVTLILGSEGKADLSPANVFVTWPPADPTLEITLGKTIFTCEDIGEKEVGILIKNSSGDTWEKTIKVIVKDQTSPVLVPKNINIDLDVTKGVAEITPGQVLAEFGDNCGIKSLTINKNRFTCEDIGKEVTVAIRAEDHAGNVKEAVAVVTIKRFAPEIVNLVGTSSFCEGQTGILELGSAYPFEVVRWRRNGVEIQGQTGKKLEVTASGVYHAVIRYQGGCLAESKDFEVKVNPVPKGEIAVDGNILRAPEGDFTYQWFRNGEKLEGSTSRTFTAQQMGEYSVELTSTAGCKAKLKAVILAISGLIGKAINEAENLKIYPNPASDRVVIEFPDGALVSRPSFSLYSSEGKNVTDAVQISTLNDSKVEILLNRLANGTYLIWVIGQDQKTYFGKLVILN